MQANIDDGQLAITIGMNELTDEVRQQLDSLDTDDLGACARCGRAAATSEEIEAGDERGQLLALFNAIREDVLFVHEGCLTPDENVFMTGLWMSLSEARDRQMISAAIEDLDQAEHDLLGLICPDLTGIMAAVWDETREDDPAKAAEEIIRRIGPGVMALPATIATRMRLILTEWYTAWMATQGADQAGKA